LVASTLKETHAGALIGVHGGKTTGGFRTTVGLPEDLLEAAVKRIRWVAILFGSLCAVSVTMNALVYYAFDGFAPLPPAAVAVRLMGVLDALLFVALLRTGWLSKRMICDVGLSFEVWAAFVIGATELIMLVEVGIQPGTVSSVVVWMMLFRLVIPATPIKAAVTSVASAGTIPLAFYTAELATNTTLPVEIGLGQTLTAMITALVAWLSSRWVYSMGTAVTAAREMGAYKLEKQLGAGGMGEVWKASHRMLKRPAAIKLIRPERLGPASTQGVKATLQRFEQEAQATAALCSPHTVQLFDFGTTADGAFYYVMELLHGFDLETLVEKHGPIPAERAIHYVKQACHSLADAHAVGLTHRDVKPANIFVCKLGREYDWVKLLDFGLVKVAEDEQSSVKLTSDGITAGTPAYMAPELALGGHNVGPHTDLYMLGCVAYWLLTGELVFDGTTPIEMISAHIHTEPTPPSSRTEIDVPKPFEDLIMKCLAKNPEDRPAGAIEMLEALEAMKVEPPWSRVRAQRWWDRHQPEHRDHS